MIPGSAVSFSIWAYVWSSSEDDADRSVRPGNYEVSVGVDPWGGDDGDATGVIWSRSLREYDRWIKLSVSTVAKGDKITLFTRGHAEWRVKHNCSYWDDASLQVVPPMGQVLQGASVLADEELATWEGATEDLVSGARHDDAVCRCTFPVDVHSTDPTKDKGIPSQGVRARPYDIPYRALIAKDVNGLLLAGRCISGDFIAHSSYRVTGDAVAMGEAAGVGAAVAARTARLPQDIPWPEIKAELSKSNAAEES